MGKDKPPEKKNEGSVIDEKERLVQDFRYRYARYGEEVLSIMLAFAHQPARLPLLLDRLNVRPKYNDVVAMLDAVNDYLAQEGAGRFCMLALQKHQKKKEVVAKQIDLGELQEPEAPAAAPSVVAPPVPVPVPAPAAAPPPAAEIAAAPVAPPVPDNRPVINVPGYNGPERRSGQERRHKRDRRLDLAAINKNKRYGGDRRKVPRGRRKTDQIRPEFWWRLLGTPDEHRIWGTPPKK